MTPRGNWRRIHHRWRRCPHEGLSSERAGRSLAEAVELVAQGRIRPVITRVCQLEEADEVLRGIENVALAGRACVVLS
jgi:D-arabinose 1-dehydrogenase-like Zn-dependent alcohol dehydrogenase